MSQRDRRSAVGLPCERHGCLNEVDVMFEARWPDNKRVTKYSCGECAAWLVEAISKMRPFHGAPTIQRFAIQERRLL